MTYPGSTVSRVLAAVLAVAFVTVIPSPVLAQEAQKVAEVVVSGNQNINSDSIRNVISLKPGDEYTEQAIEKDRAAIMSLGYFSAVSVHREDVPGGLKVNYEVTENPKVMQIRVLGNGPIPVEKILDVVKTKPGQVLNSTTIDQDIGAIQTLYSDEGYIAYVTEDMAVDPQTGVLTVPILVHTVESVEVTGNKKTKEYVFLREMKTQEGKYFNRKTLNEDIITVYNLDILEDIKQPQITSGADIGTVKVDVPVVEKKTGQVSVGFGYSSKQRLVGQARLSETNFRGRGQGLNLLWEQGTSEAVGGPASYEVGFYEPWIDDKHTSLSVSAFNRIMYRFSSGIFNSSEIANDRAYNERHKGGDVTLSRPLNDKTRVYLGGRFENVETDPALLGGGGVLGVDLFRIVQDGDVTTGSVRLVHNTRDFDLDPAAGGYEGFSVEYGVVDANRFEPVTLNKIPFKGNYLKSSFDVRRYFSRGGRKTTPQDRRTTLAVRLRAGVVSGTVPFFEQYFVGGSESLRGYREDRFWGDNMMLISVELRKPIAQAITGVLFVDYGDAWGGSPEFNTESLPQSSSFKGFFGTGVGMRVSTPIGHLRLDYGVGSEGARTHFSMGHAF